TIPRHRCGDRSLPQRAAGRDPARRLTGSPHNRSLAGAAAVTGSTPAGGNVMAQPSIYQQVLDPAHRANPYPLYAELRKTPVTRKDDGTYVVSPYDETFALMHDPRVSSDPRNHPAQANATAASGDGQPGLPLSFLNRDPPDHDRLRELAMRPFGPPCTPDRID